MATTLMRVCDICGSPAQADTIRFGFMLVTYEIDLCPVHDEELATVLERMSKAGRALGAPPTPVLVEAAPRPVSADLDTATVRAWAKKQGISVSDRGRIPEEVYERYLASRG